MARLPRRFWKRSAIPTSAIKHGHPIQPYDVTAHTLPLLMDVPVHAVYKPVALPKPRKEKPSGAGTEAVAMLPIAARFIVHIRRRWTKAGRVGCLRTRADASFYLSLTDADIRAGNFGRDLETIIIPDQAASDNS